MYPATTMADAMSSAVSSVIGFLEEDSNDSSVQQDAAIADISADLELLRDDPRILKALRTGQDLTRYSRKVCDISLCRCRCFIFMIVGAGRRGAAASGARQHQRLHKRSRESLNVTREFEKMR